jgi:hypothetical protein
MGSKPAQKGQLPNAATEVTVSTTIPSGKGRQSLWYRTLAGDTACEPLLDPVVWTCHLAILAGSDRDQAKAIA